MDEPAACYRECDDVLAGTPLRQGDVIAPMVKSADPWSGLAIVVTADCDLARNKHNGRLSCVPVLEVEVYLSLLYMPSRISKLIPVIESQLGAIVREYQSRIPGFDVPMDDKAVGAWVSETTDGQVEAALSIDGNDKLTFGNLADTYRRSISALSSDFGTQFIALREMQFSLGHHKSRDLSEKSILRDIGQTVQRLPGDAMYINALSDDMTAGYICYLRVLRELSNDEIAVRNTMRSFRIRYERISRLRAPFIYALSQQLGNVFSSIGLPDEYEAARLQRSGSILTNTKSEGH